MTEEFIRNRITELRLRRGVSEYQMSYDLGHSRGYVYNISSGKALPPMKEFLAICDYFGITPQQFFNGEESHPELIRKRSPVCGSSTRTTCSCCSASSTGF